MQSESPNRGVCRTWKLAAAPLSPLKKKHRKFLKETNIGELKIFGISNAVFLNMGVSENRGTPKWMVYNGKPY